MKLTFSTLACMEATLPELVEYALGAGYDALEVRLDKQDLICGTPCEQLPLALLHENGISILDLGTGVTFGGYEPEKIQRAKENADLAAFVGARAIRIFASKADTQEMNGIARALREVSDYAGSIGVEIWLELHFWFATGVRMKQLLDAVASDNVKVIWDTVYSVEYGEDPEQTLAYLGSSIAHVHIKDGKKTSDPNRVTYDLTDLGCGTMPVAEILRLLQEQKYSGYLSLEWESAWHPELNAYYPDIPTLLSAYNCYIKALLP